MTPEVKQYIENTAKSHDALIESIKKTTDFLKDDGGGIQNTEQTQKVDFMKMKDPVIPAGGGFGKSSSIDMSPVPEGQGTNVMDSVAERGTLENNFITRGIADTAVGAKDSFVNLTTGLGRLLRKGFVDEEQATSWQQDLNQATSGGIGVAFTVAAPWLSLGLNVGIEGAADTEIGRKGLGVVGGVIRKGGELITDIPGLKDFKDVLPTEEEKRQFEETAVTSLPIVGKFVKKPIAAGAKKVIETGVVGARKYIPGIDASISYFEGISKKTTNKVASVDELKVAMRNPKTFDEILNGDKTAVDVFSKIPKGFIDDMIKNEDSFLAESFRKNKKLIDSESLNLKNQGYLNVLDDMFSSELSKVKMREKHGNAAPGESAIDKMNKAFPGFKDEIESINLKNKMVGQDGKIVIDQVERIKSSSELTKLLLTKDPVVMKRVESFLLGKGIKEEAVKEMVKKMQKSWLANNLSPSYSQIMLNAINQDYEDRMGPKIYQMHEELSAKTKQQKEDNKTNKDEILN